MIKVEARRTQALAESISGIPEWLTRVYAGRGISSPADIDYRLKTLAPPESLSGLTEAVDILEEAVAAGAHIVIVGDFDADGATSCAVCSLALQRMGAAEVSYLVPNRFEFGYGLSPELTGVAAARQPDVLITVDNGISSHSGVLAAQALGITTIITDHHLPGQTLPQADAIVNPNLIGDAFPSKHLAGVGVIFYVMTALRARLRSNGWFNDNRISEPNLADLLDLVALGTVADVVPLDHNNRVLVAQGVARIRASKCRVGIKALLDVANKDPHQVNARDLAFSVAPRLNAAGRLEDMTRGIECLLTEDSARARRLALELDDINRARREIQSQMQDQAEAAIAPVASSDLPSGIVLYDSDWHQGLVGLIAGKLVERYHRPAIAFAPGNDTELKGSARSIPGFHVRDAIAFVDTKHPGLIHKFGGHAMAAGLSLDPDRLEDFKNLFNDAIETLAGDSIRSQRVIYTDGCLEERDINVDNAKLITQHGPWGQDFPEPLFDNEFEVVSEKSVGVGYRKYKLKCNGKGKVVDAIHFKIHDQSEKSLLGERVHAVYRLVVNDYRGAESAELVIEHLLPC